MNNSGVGTTRKSRQFFPLKRPYYSSIAGQIQVAGHHARGGENLKLEQSHREVVILSIVMCHNSPCIARNAWVPHFVLRLAV